MAVLAVWRFGGQFTNVGYEVRSASEISSMLNSALFTEGMETKLAEPNFEKWLILQNATYIELTLIGSAEKLSIDFLGSFG